MSQDIFLRVKDGVTQKAIENRNKDAYHYTLGRKEHIKTVSDVIMRSLKSLDLNEILSQSKDCRVQLKVNCLLSSRSEYVIRTRFFKHFSKSAKLTQFSLMIS